MIAFVSRFKSFPESVKSAIGFLYFSWIWLVVSWYYFRSELLEPRMLLSGIALCVLVPMIKNWARVLCVLCNAFVILQISIPTYVLFAGDNYKMGVILGVNILFLLVTSYYLLCRQTAAFFKASIKKPGDAEPDNK